MLRTSHPRRSPLAMLVVLGGTLLLLSGCGGDAGAHLPAGMTGSSAAHTAGGPSGVDAIDSVLGGDPGPVTGGVSTMVDDPVLAGYDGIDTIGGLGGDDVWSRAVSDWSENEGSIGLGGLGAGLDDEPMPVGYGGGYGAGDGWGYGGALLSAGGMYGGGVGMNAFDPGFQDPGLMDAGMIDDPGMVDPGFVDAGFDAPAPVMDAGFADPGIDMAPVDVGMDAGFVDAGVADVGMVDAGIGMDAGIVF